MKTMKTLRMTDSGRRDMILIRWLTRRPGSALAILDRWTGQRTAVLYRRLSGELVAL